MNTAAYIHAARDVRVGDFPAPASDTGSALVKIAAVGICGSDLHYYKDGGIGAAIIKQPFVPGHEFSAWLTEDIESLGLTRGSLVAIDPATPCHRCEWCQRGHHNLCPKVRFIGAPPVDGALTQTLSVPLETIVPLPSSITADQAAMLEPLGVCVHAMDLAKPSLLEAVTVLGCGGIGLGIIQLLKQAGVGAIHAVDPQAHRGALALKFGASTCSANMDEARANSDGMGTSLVIEATNSPLGFAHAIAAARIGGRVILVGIPDGDAYTQLVASDARRKGLDIRFSRRMGNVYPRAIELVDGKLVDVDAIVSHRFTLEETPNAFAQQADELDGLVKSLVYPNGMP